LGFGVFERKGFTRKAPCNPAVALTLYLAAAFGVLDTEAMADFVEENIGEGLRILKTASWATSVAGTK